MRRFLREFFRDQREDDWTNTGDVEKCQSVDDEKKNGRSRPVG